MVERPTKHIIGHIGDGFFWGQMTQPTVSKQYSSGKVERCNRSASATFTLCTPQIFKLLLIRVHKSKLQSDPILTCLQTISSLCQPRSSRHASPSSQQLRLAGFFCGRPCDMELVIRQSERSSH